MRRLLADVGVQTLVGAAAGPSEQEIRAAAARNLLRRTGVFCGRPQARVFQLPKGTLILCQTR